MPRFEMATTGREAPSAFRAAFPLAEAKLRPAAPRPESVARGRLLARLQAEPRRRVVSITAPPGYGKTTLLAQWMAQDDLRAAWLTIDDGDNDPSILLSYIAAALDRVEPVGEDVARALTSHGDRLLVTAVPRLASALHGWREPALLVLDDVHRLVDAPALDALEMLLEYLPPGFRVAIAARSEPGLPLARLRVRQDLLELGPQDLALDAAETAALAGAVGCALSTAQAEEVARRTEGWPAGIYLTALAGSHGDGLGTAMPGATDGSHLVARYLRQEMEERLGPDDRTFLARTSILDPVEPAIAEAVSRLPDAAGRLRRLSRDVPLVSQPRAVGPVYHYHHLLRDVLRAELADREPGLVPELHRRAVVAYEAADRIDMAVEHAFAAGDRDLATALVIRSALPLFNQGRLATVDRWLGRFTPAEYAGAPPLAVVAAWMHVMAGRHLEADHLADIADRSAYDGPSGDGSASFVSQRALLRGVMCRNGPWEMLANANVAVALEGPSSPWRSQALHMQGAALYLLGDLQPAVRALDEAIRVAVAGGAPGVLAMATRAGIWFRQGAVDQAGRLVQEALDRVAAARLDDTAQALSVHALAARIAAARGDFDRARDDLVQTQLLRPLASAAGPWAGVGALLDVARAYLALSDTAGAQIALRDAEQIVRVRPALGTLTDEVVALRLQLAGASAALAGSSSLTAAELRVLMLLPTYLSFQDIADRLGISRNTVKTHAVAIYGKLWASSRGEAVERAVELGLLEPYPALRSPAAPGRLPGSRSESD